MILPFVGAFLVLYGFVAFVTGLIGIENFIIVSLSLLIGIPPFLISLGIIIAGVGVFFLSKRVEDPVGTPLLGERLRSLGCIGCLIAVLVPASCIGLFAASYFPGIFGFDQVSRETVPRIVEKPVTVAPVSEDEKILDVVNRSIDALNAEDPGAYMLTIHPQSKFQRKDYVDGLHDAFAAFALFQTISDVEIEYVRSGEAKVSFVMIVDFNSPEYKNTKITGAYILRSHEGNWFVYDDEILKVEPIP